MQLQKTAKTFEELEKIIMTHIGYAMNEDVANTVREIMNEEIYRNVYNVYINPTAYKRRFEEDGLSDFSNMESEQWSFSNSNVKMSITNTTAPQGDSTLDYLTPLIVYGQYYGSGYEHYPRYNSVDNDYATYGDPRDFISPTRERVRENIGRIFIHALSQQGVSSRKW